MSTENIGTRFAKEKLLKDEWFAARSKQLQVLGKRALSELKQALQVNVNSYNEYPGIGAELQFKTEIAEVGDTEYIILSDRLRLAKFKLYAYSSDVIQIVNESFGNRPFEYNERYSISLSDSTIVFSQSDTELKKELSVDGMVEYLFDRVINRSTDKDA